MRKKPIVALVAAEIVSILGSRMTYLALPWFVLVTTGSPSKMTLVLAAEIAPSAILGIPSGMAVERLGARTTMLTCDAARLPLLASLPILHSADMLSFPLLLALVFAVGVFATPSFASKTVLLPDLVGEDEARLGQANALLQTASRVTMILGPPLAGVLIGVFGATEVLLFDAATFLVGFVLVADTIANLLLFAPVQILTKGGPNGSTDVIMNDVFERAYVQGDVGGAAAATLVLVAIALVIVIIQFRLLARGSDPS